MNVVGFKFTSEDYPMGQNTNYVFQITNRNCEKQTLPITSSQNQIRVNQLKHVPVVISRHRSCASNIIKINLKSFEPKNPGVVEFLWTIGFHVRRS